VGGGFVGRCGLSVCIPEVLLSVDIVVFFLGFQERVGVWCAGGFGVVYGCCAPCFIYFWIFVVGLGGGLYVLIV